MMKRYPLVRKMLNLNSMPDDIYKSSSFGHSRVWDSQSVKAGYHPYSVDSVFNWDVIRGELNGKVRKSAIVVRSMSFSERLVQAAPCASKADDEKIAGISVTLENWYVPGVPVNIGIVSSLKRYYNKSRSNFQYNSKTGKVDLLWTKANSLETQTAIRKLTNKIAKHSLAAPGVPSIIDDVRADFTAHPLGGVNIGETTDNYGRV